MKYGLPLMALVFVVLVTPANAGHRAQIQLQVQPSCGYGQQAIQLQQGYGNRQLFVAPQSFGFFRQQQFSGYPSQFQAIRVQRIQQPQRVFIQQRPLQLQLRIGR
jgi:hypothetical protein